MAVIALPNIEPQGSVVTDEWELRSLSARQQSPMVGTFTTLERPGSHWAVTPKFHNLSTAYRARMQQFLASCRGYANRFYVPLYGWTRRGSFPATELFTNTAFTSTTGWTPTNATVTAQDGALRLMVTTPAANVSLQQAVSLTQYAPHVHRSLLIDGPQTPGLSIGRFLGDGTVATNDYGTSRGLGTAVLVPVSASSTAQFPAFISSTTGFTAGAYLTIAYASLSRCALVDNGPNALLRSDEFDNASWTKTNCTAGSNTLTAPDGTATGDTLVEDSTTSAHTFSQAVTVSATTSLEYSFSVALRQNIRSWAAIELVEGTGATTAAAFVNLGAGTLGTVSASGNWANARAFVRSLGNSWYQVTIVARKTNAATAVTARIYSATADTAASYLGDGSAAIGVWRATLAQSSVPTRLRQTTTAANTGTAQTGGGLFLKGLPASTNGLLLPGDPAEVITGTSTQLVRTRASLDSDASGLGCFEFEAPIRVSPSDNAAVIIQNPLCRMMLDSPNVEWSEHSGGFSDVEFTAVEDTYP